MDTTLTSREQYAEKMGHLRFTRELAKDALNKISITEPEKRARATALLDYVEAEMERLDAYRYELDEEA